MSEWSQKIKSVWHKKAADNKTSVPDSPDTSDQLANDTAVIRASLLFDEAWYRRTNGFGEYLDAAEHYLTVGWQKGLNPSPFFDNEEYLSLYPDVRQNGINPLLHFELYGYGEGRYREQIEARRRDIAAAYPAYCNDMTGGFVRLRITNACNAKCRFCGVRNNFGAEREHAMEPKWYYEYLRPLYDRLHLILITGGDAFVAAESYNFMRHISEHYPKITLYTESNGIAFTDKFQDLAAQNLFKTHFSVNGSTAAVFARGCWEGEGGEAAYGKLMANIGHYVELLKTRGLECFAPSMSMVINRDNCDDVVNFTRMALKYHAWYICFFFDYSENDMSGEYFGYPEENRPVLKTLMEIERVLAGRVMFYFRLWIPTKEAEPMQKIVEAETWTELRDKYRDLWELSEGRSVEKEWRERNKLRRAQGKHEFEFTEDFAPAVRLSPRNDEVCYAPWSEIDLYPDGRLDFCGWFAPTLNFHDYLNGNFSENNEGFDWEPILNSYPFMAARKRILHGDFRGCQVCCPMNSVKNPIVPITKYGLDRTKIN